MGFNYERDGQIKFFENFRIDYKNNPVLVDDTDGVWKGNLLEFKLDISNLNSVLFQTVKYLSKMRCKGESIPANIILVSLNTSTAYVFKSQDYFDEIHKMYIGAASKNDASFNIHSKYEVIDYSKDDGALKLLNVLKENNFMKISLNEDDICGWAERYYRENPKATKGDFLGDGTGRVNLQGEIRNPVVFKDLILPYEGKTNEKFKYLMDKLNDRLKKKELGAFYTPEAYAKKSAELVREAIKRVPEGNDYVIIDSCSGSGNLEAVLTDEELSHCILSTYEYYEYKVLLERLGDKVRAIVPPTEANVIYSNGCVANADALSKDFVDNPIIKQYLDNPKVTVIMYENPPYAEAGAANIDGESKTKNEFKKSYVIEEMKKDYKGKITNDLANLFIYKAFKFYLRQPTDSYIVYSPVKYFKTGNLVEHKFIKGFAFNRQYFHATPSVISCILWSNEEEKGREEYPLEIEDINEEGDAISKGKVVIKKCHHIMSELNDRRKFADDTMDGISCEFDGTESFRKDKRYQTYKKYNKNIIAYVTAATFDIDAKNYKLLRCGEYDGHGFYLRSDNYLDKLPLWCAKYVWMDKWFDKNIYYNSSDLGDSYTKDKDFLKKCFIFTCLSQYNKCLSLDGSDGRSYKNELCFDDGTIAKKQLEAYKSSSLLSEDEKELVDLFDKILKEAKLTANYNSKYSYGVYQITKELNTYHKDTITDKNVYDYPELNGDLITLKTKLKAYYLNDIKPLMFKYELTK